MGEIILLIVLSVLLVAMFVLSYARKKKYNQGLSSMREELKNGDKVMTDAGIVGEVVDSYTEEGYKYFVLKSGKGNNIGYFSVHANAIYYVFGKEDNQNQPENQSKQEDKKVEEVVVQEMKVNPKTTQSKSKKKSK
jgi:preprotein translocase YajC subunit